MRQIVLAGMLDRVAKRLTTNELQRNNIRPNKAAYYASNLKEIVYIHNSSILKKSKPEWLVYQEIFEIQDKMYIKGTYINNILPYLLSPQLLYNLIILTSILINNFTL